MCENVFVSQHVKRERVREREKVRVKSLFDLRKKDLKKEAKKKKKKKNVFFLCERARHTTNLMVHPNSPFHPKNS